MSERAGEYFAFQGCSSNALRAHSTQSQLKTSDGQQLTFDVDSRHELSMKNIQVIDGAVNCVYDIFSATDEEFALIFPNGQDIAFIDEVYGRGDR